LLLLAALAPGACTEANPKYRLRVSDAGAADAIDAVATDADAIDQILIQHLVGYWKLDEAPGARSAVDSSGLGNHGVLERLDAQTAWVAGRRGGALQITGSDRESGVRVQASASIQALQRFTVAAWAYRTAADQDYASVISRQLDDSFAELYNLSFTGNLISVYLPSNPAEGYPFVTRSRRSTPVARWIHVAASFDGSQVRLYLDGIEENILPYARGLPSAANPLYLGNNKNPTDGEPMVGRLDDILLYSEALPASAIQALAAGRVPAGL
jgi:hypothetical protein